ncbi:MAG: TIGR02147 family protein [Pseudobdellovibrionaceae bacterium]
MKENAGNEKKSVFEYSNYREFVRDYYLAAKSRDKKFSHRLFSRLAGFKSSNFIKFIMDGKSNTSSESAERLARAMKLTKEETHFFKSLVAFNQATTSEERQASAREMMKCRTYRKIFPLKEALFDYTSKWYLSVLRGLAGLPGFFENPQWISQKLFPVISPAEIQSGFETLLKLNLLKRDEKGKLVQTAENVSSDDEVALSSVALFHREMMQRASESIDRVPREKRDISGITIGMSPETAKKIKEMTQKFRKEIVEVAAQDENATTIYQLNIQLFPLIEIEPKEKGGQ